MKKRTAGSVGGGLLTVVGAFGGPVLDLIGLAGLPGDLQTWERVMGDWTWMLAVVGFAVILWANWREIRNFLGLRGDNDGNDKGGPPRVGDIDVKMGDKNHVDHIGHG